MYTALYNRIDQAYTALRTQDSVSRIISFIFALPIISLRNSRTCFCTICSVVKKIRDFHFAGSVFQYKATAVSRDNLAGLPPNTNNSILSDSNLLAKCNLAIGKLEDISITTCDVAGLLPVTFCKFTFFVQLNPVIDISNKRLNE